MISTSQKEHLTYTLILQVGVLLGVGILAWVYIIPGVQKINANELSTQSAISRYLDIKENGLSFGEITSKLSAIKGKEELVKIIGSAPEDTKKAIKKSVKGDYTDWLSTEIENSTDDRRRLKQAKEKINSILPTMSPISNSVDEEYITLKEYTRFIESQFLDTFAMKSNIILGIQGISYPSLSGSVNIGTFDLRLDFKATNKNIQKLISYVNASGDPEILSFSGILNDADVPKILSNPLMTIESLTLENVLDASRPDAINNGRITIKFYVRGSSKEDITFLRGALTLRQETLQKKIKIAIEECKKQGLLCTEGSRLDSFDKKYSEFTRSIKGKNGIESSDMSILGQTATSLRTLNNEFDSLTQKSTTK